MAHLSNVGSAELAPGEGMNSSHPSTACPPRLAAWFLRHSRYSGSPPGPGRRHGRRLHLLLEGGAIGEHDGLVLDVHGFHATRAPPTGKWTPLPPNVTT
ncbi:unnamed protein product [Miscanthus lutarioriparius]|uniref:Uncharacterized protein n=1 Tax=Miscanthus lutarioriparius TaxID=422564 RepID=A0A811Q850_9POAL|nr:unnamed protein product [Miscanthus lutarioriparius]